MKKAFRRRALKNIAPCIVGRKKKAFKGTCCYTKRKRRKREKIH